MYIHVPFCLRRCGYCAFYSTTALERRQQYIDALTGAVAATDLDNREVVTVYFGGGTPSLLGEGLLRVLEALERRFPFAPHAEITLEANPGTVDLPLLAALRRGGFNRISFGLQSTDDRSLVRLGRVHTLRQGQEAVETARQAGFANISGDIILGTPGQTPAAAEDICRLVTRLSLSHLSAYMLSIEPNTPFARTGVEKDCPDSDTVAGIYLELCREMERAGYRHYEISSFALPGCESRHNTAYWKLADYLGIGPSAHSLVGGRRFFFPADLDAFVTAGDPWRLVEQDGGGGGLEEYIMLSLRLAEGLSPEQAQQRYHASPKGLLAAAKPLFPAGLAVWDGDRLRLTEKGWLVSNSIINLLISGAKNGDC